jgi:hypothetical protein
MITTFKLGTTLFCNCIWIGYHGILTGDLKL